MTRIIAGSARGRRIAVPETMTRPTSDRAREGLFSTLESLRGSLAGAHVLDLYSGSGAVGLEALSRGADLAVLVESDAGAVRVINANIETLKFSNAHVRRMPVERFLDAHDAESFDVVFADPPYSVTNEEISLILKLLQSALKDGAIVGVERASRGPTFDWPQAFSFERERRYGEAVIYYARFHC
jgi:16S rRNA (guanine966-N2)-methyltransferase